MERIVDDKDAEEFVKCYTENSNWQEDISKAIMACLDSIGGTGINSEGDLVALCYTEGSVMIVTLPKELYSWGIILRDTTETFTTAVVTNTCLSSRSLLRGRKCANSILNEESAVALETQISISTRNPKSTPKGFFLSTENSAESYWKIDLKAANQRLVFSTENKDSGYLKIFQPTPGPNQTTTLCTKWTRMRFPGVWRPSSLIEPAVIESLDSSNKIGGIRSITTYILGDSQKKLGKPKGNKDE
jgi:hypothetical protein